MIQTKETQVQDESTKIKVESLPPTRLHLKTTNKSFNKDQDFQCFLALQIHKTEDENNKVTSFNLYILKLGNQPLYTKTLHAYLNVKPLGSNWTTPILNATKT